MKKSLSFRQLRLLALFTSCVGTAVAAPYGPDGRETTWTQPDGQVLNLRVFGDEYYGRTESHDGFTMYFNKTDKTYYYAALAADGKTLGSSGVRADAAVPFGLAKHIDQSNEKIDEIAASNHAILDGERNERWSQRVQAAAKLRSAAKGAQLRGVEAAEAETQAAPVDGEKIGLTILVQFPDDSRTAGNDAKTFPTTRAKIERFCNEVGYSDNGNSGSVRDYFYDQSLGKLTYTQKVTEVITLPKARDSYNFSDYPTNRVIRGSGAAARMILTDAAAVMRAQGFNPATLTKQGNRVLATNVFFAGPDSGVWSEGLWPHQSFVGGNINIGTVAAPVYLGGYQITNIPNAAPVIGTFLHENGHLLLGYPDLYSTRGEGVGEHCLMGSANYLNGGKTPAPINVYFKELVGWATITDLESNEFLTAQIPTTGNVGYRIINPIDSDESFVVENRGEGDKWAQYTRDKGIIIWHVDAGVGGNISGSPHYGVAVMQADGNRDLEKMGGGGNRGDNTDYFDDRSPKFNDVTRPNATWWDRSRSNIDIEVLSAPGRSMTVAFGGLLPNTIEVGSPAGDVVLFPKSVAALTWDANIQGNVKIDLMKGGAFYLAITGNHPNDGSYDWTLPATVPPGHDYSLRISSLTNLVPTTDDSDETFIIADSTFPDGNIMPYGWSKPLKAKGGWIVSKSDVYEGASSLMTEVIGDGQTAALEYRSHFEAGKVSFYIKVSSEKDFDFAKFYIDGKQQQLGTGPGLGLSGTTTWIYASFPVSAGSHVFKWTYEKDDSYGELLDRVCLDGVTLPPTTQEIAVANANKEDLVDGASSSTFPSIGVGYSSNVLSFTIKNVGKADLSGLFPRTLGVNKSDFIVQQVGRSVLAPGKSTTFTVIFKPSALGLRSAELRIRSNDSDEGEFNIQISGTGLPAPHIAVSQPATNPLADNVGISNFGRSSIGALGRTKTFRVTNKGAAVLDGLSIKITGPGAKDFILSPASLPALAPGATAGFKVSFKPKRLNARSAVIHVFSNDKLSGSFEVQLSGFGTPRKAKAAPTLAQAALLSGISKFSVADPVGAATTVKATAGVEVIGGKKYRSLTIAKNDGISGTVEVSSNLLEWYSGKKYTTVLLNDGTTLKVRDNTPFTADSKRYIRVK
jgi:M6 family metalloprotease-like protein